MSALFRTKTSPILGTCRTIPIDTPPRSLYTHARLGHVWPGSPGAYVPAMHGLRQGLRELVYVEGRNLVIEDRYAAGKLERLPELFAELIRHPVDLLLAPGTAVARAAQQATTTLPIVAVTGDPVGIGLVTSLAQPGGNLTGLSTLSGEGFSGKWLELFKEVLPQAARVAYLWNPANPVGTAAVAGVQGRAPALGLSVQSVQARSPEEFERAFAELTRERAEAVLVETEPLFVFYRSHIVQLAAQHYLPVVAQHRAFTEAGGLLSYGLNFFELWRRVAAYVDKIANGMKPGDLPIEQATTFELVINLKTAQALGLTIPPMLLFQADEVIR